MAPLAYVSIGFDGNTFLLFYFPNPLAMYEFTIIKIGLFKASLWALDDYMKHNSNPTKKPAQIITIFSLHFSHNIFRANF